MKKLSFTKLNEVRELRTEPAHKIYTNDIDYSYGKEQDEILKNSLRNAMMIKKEAECTMNFV